jgi:hypothetical protein
MKTPRCAIQLVRLQCPERHDNHADADDHTRNVYLEEAISLLRSGQKDWRAMGQRETVGVIRLTTSSRLKQDFRSILCESFGGLMKELDHFEKVVLDEAAKATTMQDIGAAAGALKTISEARTALSSELRSKRADRYELVKSLSAFLVPIVSIISVVVVFVVQTKQIEATRQQIEDSEWRDLLSSLKGSPDAVYTDLTIAPRLTSFASSRAYGDQAKAIATRFMGHLSNLDGFEDLYTYVFPVVDRNNVHDVLDVARALTKSKKALENLCSNIAADAGANDDSSIFLGCAEDLQDKDFQELMHRNDVGEVARKISESRQSLNTLNRESQFLTDHLVTFLHKQGRLKIDLSNIFMANTDLSNMNLSDWNITDAIFDGIDLSNSDLRTPAFRGAEFRDSNWWDVQDIDRDLLSYVMQSFPAFSYSEATKRWKITEEAYKDKVTKLCNTNHLVCPGDIKLR